MSSGVAALWEHFEDEDLFGEPLSFSIGAGRPTPNFGPGVLLKIITRIALDADPDADPSTWVWEDISTFVRYDAGVEVSTGRPDESSRVQPGRGALVFDNRDGRFSRQNPNGPYYGRLSRNTPIEVLADAGGVAYPVLRQYVNEFPARWDKTGTDFTVPIKTGGILRRLGSKTRAIGSPLRKAIGAYWQNLMAYWPMEDGADSQTFANAVSGGKPLSIYGSTVSPGSSTFEGGGSDPLAVIGAGTAGFASGPVVAYDSPATNQWSIGGTFYLSVVPDSSTVQRLLEWHTEGSLIRWAIYWTDATNELKLEAFNRDNSVAFTTVVATITNADITNRWITFHARASQNGADIDYGCGYTALDDDPTYYDTGGSSSSAASHTLGNVVSVKVCNGGAADDTAVGHVWVLNTSDVNTLTIPGYAALNGYLAERASARLERLCDEAGVPITVLPGTALSAAMGRQASDTLLNLLRECESTDGGVLYEDGFGLGFQPLSNRYNKQPGLVLDFAQGHINEEPKPTDDDQALTNSVTATRTGGTSFIYEDEASIEDDGLYESSVTVNVWKDRAVFAHASWRVHLGTVGGFRWPSIVLNFASEAGRTLIEAWTDLPFGSRMTIANPPDQVAPDTVDVFIEGKTERLDQFTWTAELNAVPATPYANVWTLEDPNNGRVETSGSELDTANTFAPALADSEDTDRIIVSDADAANFGVGDVIKLYTYTGREKEDTTFEITSKTPDGFGFTRMFYTPDSAVIARGNLDSIGSDYAKRVDETSLSVATTVGPVWTEDPTHFPFDWNIEGERVTVTAISGATSPQTATVIRGVNDVYKFHGAGAVITLWNPPVIAL